jgi:prepilin-type N-terminal cleavage/methylation domain-containing protein
MYKQSGFTLLEISIVLVIIGLIAGAIIYGGQTSVSNTKVAGTITVIKDLSGAVFDFKGRYHYLPGDLPKAGDNIPSIAGTACDIATTDTNIGNGIIDTATEKACVAQELVAGGFIKSLTSFVSPLNNSSSQDVFVVSKSTAAVTTFPNTVQNVIEILNLPRDAANTIDRKIDDDNLSTGEIRGASGVGTAITLDIAI